MPTSFGNRLRYFRKKAGLNQEQLAELIDVHLNTVSRWENGDDAPKLAKIRALAQALNISEDDLLNDTPAQSWELHIKIADNFKEAFINMTHDMPCVASIYGNPYGATLEVSARWDTFADDDKFMDFIEQVMNSHSLLWLLLKLAAYFLLGYFMGRNHY